MPARVSRKRIGPKAAVRSPEVLAWGSILSSLRKYYSKGVWRVPVLRHRGSDPFLVLVSTVLSHRTRDEVTERATLRLLSAFPTPFALARAKPQRVISEIREVGLAKAKALSLRRASKILVSKFDGRVPQQEAELLKLPMVGPKTAHAIRVFGYRKPGLPVDTHILRVTYRLGVTTSGSIAKAQQELARSVPRRYWALLNPIIVQHGQNLCRATRPLCHDCPISKWCPRIGVAWHPE